MADSTYPILVVPNIKEAATSFASMLVTPLALLLYYSISGQYCVDYKVYTMASPNTMLWFNALYTVELKGQYYSGLFEGPTQR